jgi:hypothetical protein
VVHAGIVAVQEFTARMMSIRRFDPSNFVSCIL